MHHQACSPRYQKNPQVSLVLRKVDMGEEGDLGCFGKQDELLRSYCRQNMNSASCTQQNETYLYRARHRTELKVR